MISRGRGRRRRIDPGGAAWRSALVPGWGQWAAGLRSGTRLLILSGVLTVVLLAGVAAVVFAPMPVLSTVLDRRVLVALAVLNVLVLGYRSVATFDAWRRTGGVLRSGLVVQLVLAIAFVGVPHVWLGWMQVRSLQVIDRVFVAAPETTTTTEPSTTTTSVPSTTEPMSGGGSTSTTASTVPTTTAPTTTTTTRPALLGGRERYTALLLGSDAGPDRSGVRTDTVLVVTIDVESGALALFGLPRNLSGFEMPDGSIWQGILNEVYGYGTRNPGQFEGFDPGAVAVREVAQSLTGLSIDHVMLVDLMAFEDAVDAMGGVEVPVTRRVLDPIYTAPDGEQIPIDIQPGVHEFEGWEALAYVRVRRGSDDYDRMARQRCLVSAALAQIRPISLLLNLGPLLDTIEANVRTDLPFNLLPDLLTLVGRVDPSEAVLVGFGPPRWTDGVTERGYHIPDVDAIREAVRLAIEDHDRSIDELGLAEAGAECNLDALGG